MNALLLSLAMLQTPAGPPAPAPVLKLDHWINTSKPVSLQDYKGKVVILQVQAGFC